jgi:hypothetical protein
MKLPIKGNSLRLRISRSEVTRLLDGDCLQETVRFAPEPCAKFTYALQQDRLAGKPAVQNAENRVAVLNRADQANAWGITDRVGILRVPKAELYLLSKSNIESGMLVELSTPAR